MNSKKTKILLPYYSVTLLLFIIDRVLKYLALSADPSGFFSSQKNAGIAFSIPLPQTAAYILVIIILIFLISISLKYLRAQKLFLHFNILFIIVGAASNLIDRFKFGYVIDYINLKFWPVFNLADCMIVVGVGFWILGLRSRKTEK